MACSFYDEFRSAEPAAYHLQRRIGADGACRAHCELFSMWKPCGSFGSHFSLAREILKNIFQFQWVFGAGEPGCRSQLSYAISEKPWQKCQSNRRMVFYRYCIGSPFPEICPCGGDDGGFWRKQGVRCADGGDCRCAALCLRGRNNPTFAGVAP